MERVLWLQSGENERDSSIDMRNPISMIRNKVTPLYSGMLAVGVAQQSNKRPKK